MIIIIVLVCVVLIAMYFKRKKAELRKEAKIYIKLTQKFERYIPSLRKRYLQYQEQQRWLNCLMGGAIAVVLLLGGRWMVLAWQWDNVVEQLSVEGKQRIHWYSTEAAELRFDAEGQRNSARLQTEETVFKQNYDFRTWQQSKYDKLSWWMSLWCIAAMLVYVVLFRKKYYRRDVFYAWICLASVVFMVVELLAIGSTMKDCLSSVVLVAAVEALCWGMISSILTWFYPLNP